MLALSILVGTYILLSIVDFIFTKNISTTTRARWAMVVLLIFTGTSHFAMPDRFVVMIPHFIPLKLWLVYLTGVIEIGLGFGLLFRKTRKVSGIALMIFFLLIFPANINNAITNQNIPGGFDSFIPYYNWIRLLFQPIYILWVFWSIKNEGITFKKTSSLQN